MPNIDTVELEKFTDLARSWWDRDGASRALHEINPSRVEFIAEHAVLENARILDVGCGGGILSEALARRGAAVTGIDASAALVEIARAHARGEDLRVDYETITAEAFASIHAGAFDLVTCMELVEHVPDPASLINACAKLVRPGGALFLSTINRTPQAYALAVLGAEYVLGLLPRGTHDYRKFVRPSELGRWLRDAGLSLERLAGMHYNPLARTARVVSSVAVNYLVYARRAD